MIARGGVALHERLADLVDRQRPSCVSSQGIAAYSRSKRSSLSIRTVPVWIRTTLVPRTGDWTKRNTATLIAMSRIVATGGRRREGCPEGDHCERPYRGQWSVACWLMAQLDAIRKYLEAGMAFTQTTRAKAEEVIGASGQAPDRADPAASAGARRAEP